MVVISPIAVGTFFGNNASPRRYATLTLQNKRTAVIFVGEHSAPIVRMKPQNPHQDDGALIFAPEEESAPEVLPFLDAWKILIIDDDPGVHEVTEMSLNGFEFSGRGLQFLNAYSAAQAKEILNREDDVAIALVDVVMESEHAGLELLKYIREVQKNHTIRLILRTGQPGQAPERRVIREYDINDYKEKTELTAQKLYSTIYTSLRSYRDLMALHNNRRGLEHIIRATGHLFVIPDLAEFIQGVLEQLVALLYLGNDALYIGCECLACEQDQDSSKVIAATGQFTTTIGKKPEDSLSPEVYAMVKEAHEKKCSIMHKHVFVGYFAPHPGREDIVYVNSPIPLSRQDLGLIDLFLHNVSIAYENIILRNEVEGTQREMLYMLGESIETRSRETGQHVHRVAEYCRLIALGMGFSEREAEIIEIASPLHDFGKIGIPDSILHKSGKLSAEEWDVMKTHALIGRDLLSNSKREILKAASIIAGQHHEYWNGEGYPLGLSGEDIHIFGRIAAVADVFDALGSKRCYKEPWALDSVVDYLKEQRGRQFDPKIIDWVVANIDQMVKVNELYPDFE